MEIVIVIIMLLVGFNFVLKLTYHNLLGKLLTCAVAALFVGLMWEEATTQSKTQISDWLNRPELMLDTSVLLTVDVFFQVAFCVMMAKKLANERFTSRLCNLHCDPMVSGAADFPHALRPACGNNFLISGH